MGTLLKYLLYALILVVIYLLGVGFYEGTINQDSTVGEVTKDVADGTKQIIRDGYESTKDALEGGYNATKDKINSASDTNETTVGGFQEAPANTAN